VRAVLCNDTKEERESAEQRVVLEEVSMKRTEAQKQADTTIKAMFPHMCRRDRRALARWVLGALKANCANGPSIIQALADSGYGTVESLENAWEAWLDREANQTLDPPDPLPDVADLPDSTLSFGHSLLQWVMERWDDDAPVLLGLDASQRRADKVKLRISVIYRGTSCQIIETVVPANVKGAWMPHITRMFSWLRDTVSADRTVIVMADQGLWSPDLWAAIRANQWHPVIRVNPDATFAPMGQQRQPVMDLVEAPGMGWLGEGIAFKNTNNRIPGTLAIAWDEGQEKPWFLLTDLPRDAMDSAWYALRMWDEHGFRDSKSMGWKWQRGQMKDPAKAAWHGIILAVATVWSVAIGTRLEDAEWEHVTPGQMQAPGKAVPRRTRRSGTALRTIGIMQRGRTKLVELLTQGRQWLNLWFRPEPFPTNWDKLMLHIHTAPSSAQTA
jgi:hypothetical protein